MTIKRISLLPIEFLTYNRRKEIEEYLEKENLIFKKKSEDFDFFCEIDRNINSYYNLLSLNINILFSNTSCCLIFENEKKNFELNQETLISELKLRKKIHKNIISNTYESKINEFINLLKSRYANLKINYVFSFYIISSSRNLTDEENILVKYLAEPSLIELDDMVSYNNQEHTTELVIQNHMGHIISNYDISLFSQTYITWATLVCVIQNPSYIKKTESLITALEFKLQTTWNKCYTLSQYIDDVISNNISSTDADKFYWDFYRISQDSLVILSSTISTRADKLFKGMVETSHLEKEIYQLRDKFLTLEKFIKSKGEKQNKKYLLAVELLLFITALSSVGQLLFPLPILKNIYASWKEGRKKD